MRMYILKGTEDLRMNTMNGETAECTFFFTPNYLAVIHLSNSEKNMMTYDTSSIMHSKSTNPCGKRRKKIGKKINEISLTAWNEDEFEAKSNNNIILYFGNMCCSSRSGKKAMNKGLCVYCDELYIMHSVHTRMIS